MPSPPRCVGGTPECSLRNENVNGSMEQQNSITTIVELCKGSEERFFSFCPHSSGVERCFVVHGAIEWMKLYFRVNSRNSQFSA